MMLELHIWGPAFGLPSIDPECLAAVAYFTHAVPLGRWVLVAGHEDGMSEIKELPTLRDSSATVTGFQSIVEHLRKISSGQWDLNAHLTPMQNADCLAFSALLATRALPLLDLSLYVSTQNYTASTRPAYSNLLSFPSTWIIPSKRRNAAKARSAHLGLSSLDLDSTTPDSTKPASSTVAMATEAVPSILRSAKRSVSAAIRSPETASRIRLGALMERVLDPLADLLTSTSKTANPHEKRGPFLLSPSLPSTLDCLALGHLALFLLPDVPLPFLFTTLKDKYPALTDYVRRNVKRCYGEKVRPEDAKLGKKIKGKAPTEINDGDESDEEVELHHYTNMNIGSGDVPVVLPWRTAEPASALWSVGAVLRDTVEGVPVLGEMVKPDPIARDSLSTAPPKGMGVLPVVAGLGLGAAAVVGAVIWSGTLRGGESDTGRGSGERLMDLGETGDLLGLGRRRGNDSLPVVEGGMEGGVGVGVVVDG